jgi:hypothetical protein
LALQTLALLVLGLMCGSEFNVAAFGHPSLNRQPLETHIRIRSSMAALFGRVMPFWMAGSAVLNLFLILPFEHLTGLSWRFAAIAFAIGYRILIPDRKAESVLNQHVAGGN